LLVALEIDGAIAQNEKTRGGKAVGRGGLAGLAEGNDARRGGVEAKVGEREDVLQAVSGEDGGNALEVAKTQEERDDGLRGDGIETGGGGIVKNNGRMADKCAGDRDTTPHAARELRGQLFDGVFELDEAQGFAHARLDFFFGDAIFAEAVGDVVADGERVEECAFLKDKANLAAEGEKLVFGHGGDVTAKYANATGIGLKQSRGELECEGLAGAGLTKKGEGFARGDGEGEVAEDVTFFKAEADILKGDDRIGARNA